MGKITIDPTATTGQFVAPSLSDRLAWLNDYNLNPLRVYSVRDKAVKALAQNLGITAGKKSNVLSVSYKAEDPELAHDVVEALVTVARDEHVHVHRTRGSQAFFESQRELLLRELAQLEQRLREFKDKEGVASLVTQRDAQVGLISALQADLHRARAEQSAAAAEVERRKQQLRDQPALVVTEQTTGQPQTAKQTLRERLYELEVKEQELTLYPLIVIAILETPRFLYLCYTRAFPALVVLAIVLWLASRSTVHASAHRPALSTG